MNMDEDGYVSSMAGGWGCNDHDPAVHQGAPEMANDGIDRDCDGDGLVLTSVNPCNDCGCAEGTQSDPEIPEYVTCDDGEETGKGGFKGAAFPPFIKIEPIFIPSMNALPSYWGGDCS